MPPELWHDFGACGGIEKELFFEYYKDNKFAKGIVIEEARKFEHPIRLDEIEDNLQAPQSFRYVDNDMWNRLKFAEVQSGNHKLMRKSRHAT